MAKHRSTRGPTLPSADAIKAYVESQGGGVTRRELARAFQVPSTARSEFRQLIGRMEEDGQLQRAQNRRLIAGDRLPPVAMVDVVALDRDGEPVARPVKWTGDSDPPRITVVSDRRRRTPALGIGARALVRLRQTGPHDFEGRIIHVIGKTRARVIGVFEPTPDGGRVRPADRKIRTEYLIAEGATLNAKSGDLVVAESTGGRQFGLPKADVVERLGRLDEARSISALVIGLLDIPDAFPEAALKQAAGAGAPSPKGRADLTGLPLVTIDDEDARDHDDAVWAAADPAPDNPDGWHLVVAIADVAAYVRPGDAIDREARLRGNSVYLPDRVVPMLPEALSNQWCSLRPGEPRAAMVAHIWIDRQGNQLRHRFERALIRSAARLTYRQVQVAHDGKVDALDAGLHAPVEALYGAYAALKTARAGRGTLDLDLPERRVVFADDGTVSGIATRPRYASHRLIEEFMIAANVAVAEALTAKGAPCMYRVHDQPPDDKMEALRQYLAGYGLKLSRSRHLTPANFTQILKKVGGAPEAEPIQIAILRSQSQAEYNPDNIGHFGLNLNRYAHFTSPIRRYADLLVHRSLIRALKLGDDGLPDDVADALDEIGSAISATERRAATAERDALDRFAASFLASRVGAEFAATISGVTRFGLFVRLEETGAEGLIPVRDLAAVYDEYMAFDPGAQTLTGERSGQRFALGDNVSVRLTDASPVTGELRFELLGDAVAGLGRRRPPIGTRRAKRRRRRG